VPQTIKKVISKSWIIGMLEYWNVGEKIRGKNLINVSLGGESSLERGESMVGTSIKIIMIIGILLLPMKSFSAETVKFRYLQSVYFDERGGGLKQPEGVACNERSLLVVGDTGNDRLLRYTFQERSLKPGTEIKIPQLSNPIRIQINSKGEIFALDGKRRRVVRLTPEGAFKGYVEPEGIPSPSTFVPRSIKIDANNNIYILDIFSGRVLVLNSEGKYQKQIPFPKDYGFFSDLSVDSKGNLLLIDSVKAMVFSAPKDSNSFSPLTKSLREHLHFPTSITVDKRGTIYIVDENGGGVVLLGGDGSFMGRQLTMGWNEGLLYYPSQMSINEKGEVFIADRGNSRIQIFTLVK
jgi:DNA-binding beta-propeller fold protein YncE